MGSIGESLTPYCLGLLQNLGDSVFWNEAWGDGQHPFYDLLRYLAFDK